MKISTSSRIGLVRNPSFKVLETGKINADLKFSFSKETPMPLKVYLKAQTNPESVVREVVFAVEIYRVCSLKDNTAYSLSQGFSDKTPLKIVDLNSSAAFSQGLSSCKLSFSLSSNQSWSGVTTLGPVTVSGSLLVIDFPSLWKSLAAEFSFYLVA